MNIVILTHPPFLASHSMPRYANMVAEGMKKRQHSVEFLTASELFYKIPVPLKFKKWLGYVDQFVVFRIELFWKLRRYPSNTIFVFADHALGPWMPLLQNRPFVVHCHDFMAQRSALGEIEENKVSLTGKIYQAFIRSGYKKGKNFICISEKTRKDLLRFLKGSPNISEVIYNGLNLDFQPGGATEARRQLEAEFSINVCTGYILHVGGNQFYKNRKGVILIYNEWRKMFKENLPLLMVGPKPTEELLAFRDQMIHAKDIHFLTNVNDDFLKYAYQGATLFLFPSLDEGFGWPIAEALASGCPVITTAEAPMTEVGSDSCYYIPRMPQNPEYLLIWSQFSARVLNKVSQLSSDERNKLVLKGIENAKRYDTDEAIKRIEKIYEKVLERSCL